MHKSVMIFTLLFLCLSCNDQQLPNVPNVQNLKERVEIYRFDKALRSLDKPVTKEDLMQLRSKSPAFFDLYVNNVVSIGDADTVKFVANFNGFLRDSIIMNLHDTVAQVYPNLSDIEAELSQSFAYLTYYFPSFTSPNIYGLISDFGYQRFIFNDIDKDGIGIGLDMFLGEKFPYKSIDPQNPAFSDYLTRTFNQEHIVRKIIGLVVDDIAGNPPGMRMIDQMIHNGKKLYLIDQIMPYHQDSVIFEYSANQLKFVNNNELQMWSFITEENLLYETNNQKINKYINPSPNSPGMPNEAPGQVANYLGYRIVESYMRKFPDTTFEELFKLIDSQEFLEKSRFRPKSK